MNISFFLRLNGDYLPDLLGTDINGKMAYWIYVPETNGRRFVGFIIILTTPPP